MSIAFIKTVHDEKLRYLPSIVLKRTLGKLPLPTSPKEFVPAMRQAHGICSLPIDERAALLSAKLPNHHRDPFDRMLVCQAIAEGAQLATPDPLIAQYPITVCW